MFFILFYFYLSTIIIIIIIRIIITFTHFIIIIIIILLLVLIYLKFCRECMEGVHGIDIWNVGFPWMHDHWRWNGYHIEIGRYVLGELKERWL